MATASRVLEGATLPFRLQDLERPPERLYLQGELPRGPAVAIVGTRTPTPPALKFARKLASELGRAGVAVLSGGARGIDTAAHRGALAASATTVIVAPAGYSKPYPEENGRLFRTIVQRGGAYLSPFPDGDAATQPAFFARNACLAALAHVVVVVEAPFRSGARNAAAWARRLGRPLLAVPCAPWNERGGGGLLELRLGASLCLGSKDVLRELERASVNALPSTRRQTALPFSAAAIDAPRPAGPDASAVLGAIAAGACHLDEICARTGLPASTVQNHVLTLTLEGVIAPDPAGRPRLVPERASLSD